LIGVTLLKSHLGIIEIIQYYILFLLQIIYWIKGVLFSFLYFFSPCNLTLMYNFFRALVGLIASKVIIAIFKVTCFRRVLDDFVLQCRYHFSYLQLQSTISSLIWTIIFSVLIVIIVVKVFFISFVWLLISECDVITLCFLVQQKFLYRRFPIGTSLISSTKRKYKYKNIRIDWENRSNGM
jgi:hypothetical protein